MSLDELPAGLHEAEDVTRHYDLVERAAAEGRAGDLYELALTLRAAEPGWQRDAVLLHIQQALALTPGPGNAACAVRLAATEQLDSRVRLAAAQLASAQPVDNLLPLYEEYEQAPELFACLTQELVLRHPDIGQQGAVRRVTAHLADANHPLAILPPALLPFEDALDLPSYSLRGASYAIPFGPVERSGFPRRPGHQMPAVELLAPGLLTAAVENWAEDSNGRIEARAFRLAMPAELDAELLEGLGLTCLAGEGEVTVRAATPSEVMRVLFAAAAIGSAYGSGRGGAYGRLLAWQSMTALAGGTRVEDAAGRTWVLFDASTAWFYQVAWDVGIAALDPDRLLVHVLAATDTD
ncbi:DUF6183 family protein [Nonomuraea sp. C10]|uniref:DUF6183 family protein n=1 Tax=Nonomuraea sp. C10 TaxID=2600577 RepID=UPI0011CDEDFA|nr:DUF6183 family protein [Nonomuraea sp. C10]TXK39818.1 hypothetical protein FR742_09630 [Nonomuraea sp. C10]